MKKLLFIYNPSAGRKKYYPVEKIIKNYFKEEERPYHVTWQNIAKDKPFNHHNPDDFDLIFAVGGDGTVKETASWIVNHRSETPLAIIPCGSANLLAITLGIPLYVRKALIFNLTNLPKKIDVGIVNNRYYFLIAAGCGFDAKVIRNTSRKLKKIIGFFAYFWGIFVSFLFSKRNKVFIKSDDTAKTFNPQSVLITNVSKLFNITLNPESKSDDGYLNVSIFNTLTLKSVFIIIFKILKGNYKKDWRYHYFKTKDIYILPMGSKIPMQIDGDIVDLPYMDIKLIPQALNIIGDKQP